MALPLIQSYYSRRVVFYCLILLLGVMSSESQHLLHQANSHAKSYSEEEDATRKRSRSASMASLNFYKNPNSMSESSFNVLRQAVAKKKLGKSLSMGIHRNRRKSVGDLLEEQEQAQMKDEVSRGGISTTHQSRCLSVCLSVCLSAGYIDYIT